MYIENSFYSNYSEKQNKLENSKKNDFLLLSQYPFEIALCVSIEIFTRIFKIYPTITELVDFLFYRCSFGYNFKTLDSAARNSLKKLTNYFLVDKNLSVVGNTKSGREKIQQTFKLAKKGYQLLSYVHSFNLKLQPGRSKFPVLKERAEDEIAYLLNRHNKLYKKYFDSITEQQKIGKYIFVYKAMDDEEVKKYFPQYPFIFLDEVLNLFFKGYRKKISKTFLNKLVGIFDKEKKSLAHEFIYNFQHLK